MNIPPICILSLIDQEEVISLRGIKVLEYLECMVGIDLIYLILKCREISPVALFYKRTAFKK